MERSDSALTRRRRTVKTASYAAFHHLMAARMAGNEADDPAHARRVKKRARDRRAARSEGVLNWGVFMKTLLYELPPIWVGGLACALIDGLQVAQSRLIAPPNFALAGLLQYAFMTFVTGLPYIAVVLAFCLDNPRGEWSLVEPLQLMVYYGLWKVTLAAKHAVAGSLHCNGLYGLDSNRFIPAERMARIQFNCWVNGQANQPGAVLEELYTACLRNDFDLACLEFDVGSEVVARKIAQSVEWWKIVAATSLGCKASPTPDWHPASKNHYNSQFTNPAVPFVKPGRIKTTANDVGAASDATSEGTEEAVALNVAKKDEEEMTGPPPLNELAASPPPTDASSSRNSKYAVDVIRDEQRQKQSHMKIQPLPRCPVSRYAEDDDFCLFETFFRDTNDPRDETTEALLRQGKVPATYLAFLVGVQNWRAVPQPKMMAGVFFCIFAMVFLPNICRAMLGKAAFGSTENAQLVLGFSCVGSFFPIMLLFAYNVNCSVEMLFRYNASTMMRDFLLPEGAKLLLFERDEASGKLKSNTLTHVHVSLSRACNAVSWGAVRELMHGASFCAFMHSKANVYIACSFAAAIGVSSIASFGGMLLRTGDAGVEVSLPGVIKSLCFSMALGVYVILAYRVNFSTRYHRQEIARARVSVLAEINELEKRATVAEETSTEAKSAEEKEEASLIRAELAELKTAAELLQVVDKQTTVSDHANPVRAMGLVAEPAVLSVIMSILVATLYLELQKLAETVFFAVPDGGSSVMAGAIATTPAPSSSSPFP
jgi:hypothetical protein